MTRKGAQMRIDAMIEHVQAFRSELDGEVRDECKRSDAFFAAWKRLGIAIAEMREAHLCLCKEKLTT